MINHNDKSIYVWGPTFWYVYHKIAFNYDEKVASENEKYKQAHLIFYNNFEKILPCHKCRVHYTKLKNNRPVNRFMDTKDNFFEWSVKNHNIVNNRLNKKKLILQRAKEIYRKPLRHNMVKKFVNYIFNLSLRKNNLGIIKKIINNLIYVLPCQMCKKGLDQKLKLSNNLKTISLPRMLKVWYQRNHQFHVGL